MINFILKTLFTISFIYIEHFYIASLQENYSSAPNSSRAKKSGLKVRKNTHE